MAFMKPNICIRDSQLYPVTCTRQPPCDKLFKTDKSEKEHRRSGRCKLFLCAKCGDTFKDNISKCEHKSICDVFHASDEEILAEIQGDIQIDSDFVVEGMSAFVVNTSGSIVNFDDIV